MLVGLEGRKPSKLYCECPGLSSNLKFGKGSTREAGCPFPENSLSHTDLACFPASKTRGKTCPCGKDCVDGLFRGTFPHRLRGQDVYKVYPKNMALVSERGCVYLRGFLEHGKVQWKTRGRKQGILYRQMAIVGSRKNRDAMPPATRPYFWENRVSLR